MDQTASIKELATALLEAQKVFKPIARNADNPFFRSTYADLAAVFHAIQGPLTANGLSYVQATDIADDGDLIVETQLMHTSGEWIRGRLKMPPAVTGKNPKGQDEGAPVNRRPTPQQMGSAFTYARRYALAAIVGIPVEGEDDDGNAGSGNKNQGQGQGKVVGNSKKNAPKSGEPGSATPPPNEDPAGDPPGEPTVTGAQLKSFCTMLTRKGYTNEDLKKFLAEAYNLQAASSKDIPAKFANNILEWIDGLEAKGGE